jgi:MFS family permease
MSKTPMLAGMRGFTLVWAGQFLSFLGTGMTNFALTIWAWKTTGTATALALVALFNMAPSILASPVAGALVDRWNRKLVMMLSDIAAGISTLAILLLFTSGRLEIWHLYVTTAFAGFFHAFQFPAYSAAISTMVSKEHYTRASGMLSLAQNASGIFAPVAAGILLNYVSFGGVFLLDLTSLALALSALLLVRIPQPKATDGDVKRDSLLKDSIFGFKYIFRRPGLLGLQLILFNINFTFALCFPLLAPMILALTGNDMLTLGAVQSAFGVGGVVGGILLSVWGGPKRRIHGIFIGMTLSSVFGMILLGVGREAVFWIAGGFVIMLFHPLINGSNQAIWQSKVPPEVQGRVFSARSLIAMISAPIAMAITGPLADRLLIPGMMAGGRLAPTFGWLVGTGQGAGISLLYIFTGFISLFIGLAGYLFKQVRDVEKILPDHDEPAAAGTNNL